MPVDIFRNSSLSERDDDDNFDFQNKKLVTAEFSDDVVLKPLLRDRRSADTLLLLFLSEDDVDFENQRLRNVGNLTGPFDAVKLESL